MKNKVLWITRTAVLTALLITTQLVTAGLGNTLITGSCVNFILIITVMTCGVSSGVTVALISPVMAKLIGIGPLWSLIPFIAAGNTALVVAWHLIGTRESKKQRTSYVIAAVMAAGIKLVVLYFGIVRIMVPLVLKLPEKQAAVISSTFSLPQLFTALIGGGLAVIVLPVLLKAIKRPKKK